MGKKEAILILVFLLFATSVYSIDEGDVILTYSYGEINIKIDADSGDEYFNQLQFYNDASINGTQPPTPEGFLSKYVLCNENCIGENEITLKFGDIKIFDPGTHYLVIHDLGEEEERNIIKEFYVEAFDLLGCYYNNAFVADGICVADVTGNEEHRPLYCDRGEINSASCGICGCESGKICCPNPKYECGFGDGYCVDPAEIRRVAEIQAVSNHTLPIEEVHDIRQCNAVINLEEFNIPKNTCINQIILDRETLSLNNNLFSNYCQCRILDLDLDKDGFNSTGYYGGNDCDDSNSAINPNAFEICGNNIDEDCDGMFNNNCGGICDTDKDGHDEFSWCFDSNPDDDCNDNDIEINPKRSERCDNKDNDCDDEVDEGFENFDEICGNEVDENCNGQLDDDCICEEVFEDGVKLLDIIPGLCSDGLRECVKGKRWSIISEANNGINGECPLITYFNQQESNFIEVSNNEVIKLFSTYVCTNPRGCRNINIRIS